MFTRRPITIALIAGLLSACAAPSPPALNPPAQDSTATPGDLPDLSDDQDTEEDIAFDKALRTAIAKTEKFLTQTMQGRNLGDYALGIFVSNLLGTMSEQEPLIGAHIFADGRLTDGYLTDVFQYNSAREIAFFETLNAPDNPDLPKVVARALAVLEHIPDTHGTPDQQAADRYILANDLIALKTQLTTALDSR